MELNLQSALIGFAAGFLIMGLVGLLLRPKSAAAPAKVEAPKPAPPPPKKASGEPLRLLALLQAESRLLDFLMEDISSIDDAQVGHAVRDIHSKAKAALGQHLTLDPVLSGTEGEPVTVPKGFDPSAIRVLGNVAGEPPYTGTLQHAGWRAKNLKLAAPPKGADEFVLQPAEVQIG